MTKVNLTAALKHLYRPSTTFEIVEVPPLTYLMYDGSGNPNTAPAYTHALESLYPVAYAIKFLSKQHLGRDYVVPPLEGLWWSSDWSNFTTQRNKELWQWTMMILLPEWIPPDLYDQALQAVRRKKPHLLVDGLRMESYHEGRCVQIMHHGAYDDEGPVLARLHQEWLPTHGYRERGKHHEIYLSDPRRVPSSKLKTVLRQPIQPRENPTSEES